MDTAECEALINAVYKRPGLYDKTSKLHSNRQYAVQAWREISEETNIEENLAKRKWSNLRDYFQRQLRETHTTKSGTAPTKKKKWALYDAMSFLVTYLTDRSTSRNLQESSMSFDTAADNGDDEVDEVIQDTPILEVFPMASSSASIVDTCAESAPKRKNASRNSKDESQLLDREILETLKDLQPKTTSMEEDEDLLFFKNLVPKMKCMTDIQKLELQIEINNVFLKHLKRAKNPSPSRNVDNRSRNVCYNEYTTRPDDEYYNLKFEQP